MRKLAALFLLGCAAVMHAQTDTPVTTNNGTPPAPATTVPFPSAPAVQTTPRMPASSLTLPGSSLPATEGLGISVPVSAGPNVPLPAVPITADPALANAPTLTLAQAEQMALKHNPRIDIAHLLSLAQGQVTREQRAAYYPTLAGAATAVDANDASRITAGALNNPVLYSRAAFGATLNQLLTDFGRTHNLAVSADLRAKSAESTAMATRDDVIFAVDQAFYRALGAQALIEVANQTVNTRQATSSQIGVLTNARLRSTLDLSFANADLAQAQLLVLDARNQSIEAQANLSALMGDETTTVYRLIDETPSAPPPAPMDAAPLVQQAFAARPDLTSLKQQADAQHRFVKAERDLSLPSINALGAVGDAPERSKAITSDWYGAVGVNVTIPVFNGFLYSARAHEAQFRAAAADQQVRQLRDTIARDVTTTVLQAQSNFSRIAVSQQLADDANSAFSLAQTRYKLGLSSIVELSQAQLLQTRAQIELTNARYAYQGSLAALRYQTGQ